LEPLSLNTTDFVAFLYFIKQTLNYKDASSYDVNQLLVLLNLFLT